MVNVYFFSDGAAPAGYSEIDAGYRDRLVKLGATPLTTGGASTHVHTGSATHDANANIATKTNAVLTASIVSGNTHTHPSASVSTVSNGSNFATYRTLRCHYRSVSGWTGDIPAGLIAFSESVPASGWERFWDGHSEFIMISGTYNNTGGGTHSHDITGTVANANLSRINMRSYIAPQSSFANYNHGHTFSTNITGSAYDYYYWSCGLVKSNTMTHIYKEMYVLFDGDPGTGWEDTGVSSKYLKCSATNSIATGGSYLSTSHSHSGDVNSSGATSCANSSTYTSNATTLCSHYHVVHISLASGTAEPSWVGLSLYKATSSFGNLIRTRSIFVITC